MFASALDFSYLWPAEDTPARQCSNKFDIALAYPYLCGACPVRTAFGSAGNAVIGFTKNRTYHLCAVSSDISGSKEAYPVLIKGLHRLEYRGYDSSGVAMISDEENSTSIRPKERSRRWNISPSRKTARYGRHCSHALGDARRTQRHKRPSPRFAVGRSGHRTQRDDRELYGGQEGARTARLRVPQRDRYGGGRPADRLHPYRHGLHALRSGARGVPPDRRRLCHRGDRPPQSQPDRRGAQEQPAGDRRRRRRVFHRVGRNADRRIHEPRGLSQRRRDRRHQPGRVAPCLQHGQQGVEGQHPETPDEHLGTGKGGLSPLHAQRDLRAARTLATASAAA